MRTMKEHNYNKCRELLRAKSGGTVLGLIRQFQDDLLEDGVFDLVFEGFWDLYLLKPKFTKIGPKKLL